MSVVKQYILRYKKLFILTLGLATINQFFSLLDPQIFRLIIDNYATKATSLPHDIFIKGVGLLLLAAVGAALISRIAKNFQEYFVSSITERVGTAMYADSVDHTFSLPFSVFEDRRSGEILQKLQKARDDTKKVIESMISNVFLAFVGTTFVVIYAFIVHWIVGLIYFLIIPILGFFTFIISKKIRKAQQRIVIESAELAGSTTETLRNVELVKSLGLEEQEISRLNNVNDKILALELRKVKQIRTLNFIQGTLINAIRSTLLLVMLLLVFNGGISIGEFFTLFIYSFFVFTPLTSLGMIAAQYQEARASVGELDKILAIPRQKPSKDAKKVGIIKELKLENVGFSYAHSDKASLHNISLDIKQGETIGLVGASGSGKSTIVKLLVGLYTPQKGKITYNGEKNIDYALLRKRISLVSQETQLFAGTIRENLLFVRPNASDKECKEALAMAKVGHIIKRTTRGLGAKIGEGGIKLSGGERQRLAIARAILRRPDIIIFDEATSSLDSITEQEITKTIRQIIEQKPELIVIIVAHRLSTVRHADNIIVMQHGSIVEVGTHKSLVSQNGTYASFWQEQQGIKH